MTEFTEHLGLGLWGARLCIFETLPSTNTWAMANIVSCGHGDVVRAARQTAGRGRFEREWIAPEDNCLTISVVLDPAHLNTAPCHGIGLAAAIAARSALERHSIAALLKWPNDVIAGSGKICGILAERDAASGIIVLGIGLNVNLTPNDLAGKELLQPATSMAIEAGSRFSVDDISAYLLRELEDSLDNLAREGMPFVTRTWPRHDFLAGKHIEIRQQNNIIRGEYLGLAEDGNLRLLDDAGTEHHYLSGDVSIG